LRRTEAFVRRPEVSRQSTWGRIVAMRKPDKMWAYSFWWFQSVGWGCFYLLSILVVLPYIQQPGELGYQGVRGLLMDQGLMCVCGFLASLALRPVCRSLVRRPLSWMALEVYAAGWSLIVGIGIALVAARLIVAQLELVDLLEACAKMSVLLFLWCNLYFSIKRSRQQEQERERLLRAEGEVHQARLRALRYQLNPHFLFNSMNAVSTLVAEGNGPCATKALSQIAEFLRAALDDEAVAEVPLLHEIGLTERYLAIEQTRLEGRLRVNLAISPETLDALVPCLMLQPLVENAVRHGVAPLVEGGTIAVRSERHGSRLHITVINSGHSQNRTDQCLVPQAAGIGLTNTAERLKTLYGTDHKFGLEWPATGGCRVIVELPFRISEYGAEVKACA
jgi:two-component system LytT family sensor kinase